MQNDIVRQPPQNQEIQSEEVVQQVTPEPAQVANEVVPAEQPAVEVTQAVKSSSAPVGVIILALTICAVLCSAAVYATYVAQS